VPDLPNPGEATVRRLIDREHDCVFAHGDFGALFAAYLDHVRRWESTPDGLAQAMMRQGLGAAALHVSCRPKIQTVAWTLNVAVPPLNLFLTCDGDDSTVAGRVYTEGVKTAERSRLFVETSMGQGRTSRGMIEFEGLDVLDAFEAFYRRSEQVRARLFELNDVTFALVQGLPGADAEWLASLDRETVGRLLADGLEPIEERAFRFECGCDEEKMLGVLRGVFGRDPEELFRGDATVETFCPRCGHRWTVTRDRFEDAGD
jgi:molecular chaperone Hsp33